ncbi:NAD(+) synthase [uncultured Veillonella sp.]|uniref:NAD(+) synthase n=1 Tax=uncultured Veillonella sp. TaxID=159268 RepID=UPI00320ADD78
MLDHPESTKEALVQWIRDYFSQNGPSCSAVVGISGGKDSTIVAALCKEALGAERVVGVLMPNGIQSDIDDAKAVVAHLGIPHIIVNIGTAYEALTNAIIQGEGYKAVTGRSDISKDAGINTPPRLRMTTLYAVGQNLPNGARVANTCNGSEDYVGYSTKYGDTVLTCSNERGFIKQKNYQLFYRCASHKFLSLSFQVRQGIPASCFLQHGTSQELLLLFVFLLS